MFLEHLARCSAICAPVLRIVIGVTGERSSYIMANNFLIPFSRPRFCLGMVVLMIATLVFFRLVPGADIAVSRAFFEPSDCSPSETEKLVCGYFATGADSVLKVFRWVLQILPAIAAGILLLWAAYRFFRHRDLDRLAVVSIAIAFATLILSPLVIVNGIFKEFWGRPRPYMVDLFGGDVPFIRAGTISDLCNSNCSFISGEAAGAFWLICLVSFVPKADRTVVFVALLTIATAASLLRVAFGSHFLSDVVLGGAMTVTVFSVLALVATYWVRRFPSVSDEGGRIHR